jgi:UDPglucose 6-dehydrogenase
VASNPEFLREGQAVYDFLHPDRIVIGVRSKRAEKLLREIYDPIIGGKFDCPVHDSCSQEGPVPFIVTDINSAELIKHASNSFLATKISFINAIADICERTGANVKDVAYGMGLDSRIGKDFLKAGIGFGGFCFPKDLQSFIRIAEKYGYDFGLLKEVEKINEERVERVIEKLKTGLWLLKGKTIGLLGLSFKPDTDDTRFAPALKIAKSLLNEEAIVKAYDPQAMGKAKKELSEIRYCDDPYQVAEGSDALIICTEWEEFKNLDWDRIKSLMGYAFILDGRNTLDKERMKELGFEYVGMGI